MQKYSMNIIVLNNLLIFFVKNEMSCREYHDLRKIEEEERAKTPFQVMRVRIHKENLKLANFWSKVRNLGRVGIGKRCVELLSMFVSYKTWVLIFLCFL